MIILASTRLAIFENSAHAFLVSSLISNYCTVAVSLIVVDLLDVSAPDPKLGYRGNLRKKLLSENYDKWALPSTSKQSLPLELKFGLTITGFTVVRENQN